MAPSMLMAFIRLVEVTAGRKLGNIRLLELLSEEVVGEESLYTFMVLECRIGKGGFCLGG